MLGIIRVITLADPRAIAAHGEVVRRHFGLPVLSACIEDQPEGIYDDASEAVAVPKIVAAARQLRARGCGAIGISCAADPALAECRAALDVPVIGAGSAAGYMARSLAGRIGVLTILDATPRPLRTLLGEAYTGHGKPEGVRTTLDLQSPAGQAAAIVAAGKLIDGGAQAIVLACTGFATLEFAPVLRRHFGIPFIDPIVALGACAVPVLGA